MSNKISEPWDSLPWSKKNCSIFKIRNFYEILCPLFCYICFTLFIFSHFLFYQFLIKICAVYKWNYFLVWREYIVSVPFILIWDIVIGARFFLLGWICTLSNWPINFKPRFITESLFFFIFNPNKLRGQLYLTHIQVSTLIWYYDRNQ